MHLQADFDLRAYNTFQLEARSALGGFITSEEDLREALAAAEDRGVPLRLLGGGSNVVLSPGFEGVTALMRIAGKRIVDRSAGRTIVEAAAGEDWSEFVQWTLGAGLSGIENLSGIPGTVGAAPVQNIGAYGVELAERLESLRAYDRIERRFRTFGPGECRFSYRHSIFKDEPGRYAIVSVRLALPTEWTPVLSYAGIRELAGHPDLSPTFVSKTVVGLRAQKLPDWRRLGNAGSFFRNPVLTAAEAAELQRRHPDAPAFLQADGRFRVSAAWLIERAGLKGYREGGTGVSENHALVLVNHGGASQMSIAAVAERIKQGVREQFGVTLVEEPVYA